MEASRCCIITTVVIVLILLLIEGIIIGLLVRRSYENESISTVITTTPGDVEITDTTTAIDLTKPWNHFRLPNNLIPIKYNVSLRPDMKEVKSGKYKTKGSSSVIFECKIPTEYIVMHAAAVLSIDKKNVLLESEGSKIDIVDLNVYATNQYIVLTTAQPCIERKYYALYFTEFSFSYSDNDFGLYIDHAYTSDGELSTSMVMSQMEPMGARETFPCFDEPSMKANFTVTLWYIPTPGRFALSNTPAKSHMTQVIDGETWNSTTFEETVRMSTYILVFVITDYSHMISQSKSGISVRTYATKHSITSGYADYGSEMTPKMLDFFEETFEFPYSLNNSDQIVFPKIAFVAMENWGLVSYSKNILLYNKEVSSVFDKTFSTNVIGHEIAHQWFGNVVTPEWWSDFWLNEGFATYLSYIAQETVQPNWSVMSRFFLENFYIAMEADVVSSHSLVKECTSFDDIQDMWGTLTYHKGACILRMIHAIVGDENFINSLKVYLKDLAYNTSTSEQFFSYLEPESEKDKLLYPASLTEILNTWISQIGYPLLNIAMNDEKSTYTITQEAFATRKEIKFIDDSRKWYVPFVYNVMGEGKIETKRAWILPDLPLEIAESGLILANVDAVGYYRINYDNETWIAIANYLNSDRYAEIPEISRAQLIGDAFKMFYSNRLDIMTVLELTKYLTRETNYLPWKIFVENLRYLENMVLRSPVQDIFFKYMLQLINPLYEANDWLLEPKLNDSEAIKKMAIQLSVKFACRYGNMDCIKKSIALYDTWMKNPHNTSVISITYRQDVMCTAIQNGGGDEWRYAWDMLQTATNSKEKERLRYALACGQESWMLLQLLEHCVEDTGGAWKSCIPNVAYNINGPYITWLYVLERVQRKLSEDIISIFSEIFSTASELQLLYAFNTTNPLDDSTIIEDTIVTVTENIKWKQKNGDKISTWLHENTLM